MIPNTVEELVRKLGVAFDMFTFGFTWGAIRYVSVLLPVFALLALCRYRPQWRTPFQRIQRQAGQWKRETIFNLSTLAVGGLLGPLFAVAGVSKYSHFYYDVDDYGWAYLFISYFLMLAIRETLAFWFHRLMHIRRLFRRTHRGHHLSIHVTPMSGYSMQPAETIFDSVIPSLVILLLVPVHPVVFGIFWWIDTVWSVMGHSGIEIFPRGTPRHWLGRWLNTPTAHSLHHTEPRYNHGFYFLFWDRVCGTVHPEYERHFEAHLNPAGVPAGMRPVA